ncbi:MAG: GWxTD domain-containing protein [Flavobacteriales bacterium]|nr:GWxTD domain-containing protein [Flavobacteriales bacterium]
MEKGDESIAAVKANFATRIKPGWQTDRGRVYLKYGKPNTRIQRPSDPDYWPFEIWHYYVTDSNLHNRRFLFYDTNLSGDMELLHSDVPEEVKIINGKTWYVRDPQRSMLQMLPSRTRCSETDPRGR